MFWNDYFLLLSITFSLVLAIKSMHNSKGGHSHTLIGQTKLVLLDVINITTWYLSYACFHKHTFTHIQEAVSHSACGKWIWTASKRPAGIPDCIFLRLFIHFKVNKKIQKIDPMTRDVLDACVSLKAPLPRLGSTFGGHAETDRLQHEIPDPSQHFPSGCDALHPSARWTGAVQGQMVRTHDVCCESGSWAQ